MTVRAIYDAAKVADIQPPYDTIHLKVYYPASLDDSMEQINMGVVPARDDAAPWPVAIFMPGTNVPVESYAWLAKALAEHGIVTVLYSWIKEDMPGFICLSPGIELKNLTPTTFGMAPTASALPALYSALQRLNNAGVLKDRLDLQSIIIGGHSAGGSAALLNNNPDWFPWLKACFTYAAHAAASTQLGFANDSMLTLCSKLPYLLLAGSRDGVIAASSFRYGDSAASDCTDRIVRTFSESIDRAQSDTHFVKIRGANHFSFTYPCDSATGRQFLDLASEGSDDEIRSCMTTLIVSFIKGQVLGGSAEISTFSNTINSNPLIAEHRCK
jgi:predicted dienelactone hydrolase